MPAPDDNSYLAAQYRKLAHDNIEFLKRIRGKLDCAPQYREIQESIWLIDGVIKGGQQ